MWRLTDVHLAAIDHDGDYRQALIDWFHVHGLDPWTVRAAAITAAPNPNLGPRLEVLVAVRGEDGRPTGQDQVVSMPLHAMPPEPKIGWHSGDRLAGTDVRGPR